MTSTLADRLAHPDPSARLQAALDAGAAPDAGSVDPLVARCAVEPDFFVRDMLTWALTRLPRDLTVPRLLAELGSSTPQSRSQALHTLAKIGAPEAWPAVSGALLHDEDEEVARSAWRAAVVLIPRGAEPALAAELASELGRGEVDLQRSLSRALVALGEAGAAAVAGAVAANHSPDVLAHAIATKRLLDDPDAGFLPDLAEAKRIHILRGAPIQDDTTA
jgi:HEAT repeat protein